LAADAAAAAAPEPAAVAVDGFGSVGLSLAADAAGAAVLITTSVAFKSMVACGRFSPGRSALDFSPGFTGSGFLSAMTRNSKSNAANETSTRRHVAVGQIEGSIIHEPEWARV
jgi:hypothetical protein